MTMALWKVLIPLVFIAALSTVDANPQAPMRRKTAALGFTTKLNPRGVRDIVESDRARIRAVRQAGHLAKCSNLSTNVMNNGMGYLAQVQVGNPATNYTLLVDIGSSITFVTANASKPYVPTSASRDTGNTVSLTFGNSSAVFSGEEWLDSVALGPGLVVNQQSIGVINSTYFTDFDGILGLGPVDLTTGRVSNTSTVPTVMDNLKSQGTISEEVLGIYFTPASESNYGELTFGGHDSDVITSDVNYVPITTTSPASLFWGIDESITYGDTPILSTTAGIVDTGNNLVYLSSDGFERYKSATGATTDPNNGFLTITSEQYENLKPLTFHIGDKSYALTPNAQIWPRALNTRIGGTPGSIYLVVADLGWSSDSGPGVNVLNGYTFLERFYSVFDTTNRRVGFATTRYTNSMSN